MIARLALALALLVLVAGPGMAQPIPGSGFLCSSSGTILGFATVLDSTGASLTGGVCTPGGGGGGAPTGATYITQTPDAGLSAEQAMSLSGTGLVKNTTGTGVLSIYAGTTCGGADFLKSLDASGAGTCGTPAGGGTVTHTAGALTANQLVIGNGADDLKVLGTLGTTTTVLHGNAAGAPTFGAVVSGDLNITATSCTNQAVTAISSGGVGTCSTVSNAMLANSSITVTGTANQVNVAGSPVALGGTVTLSAPQNIHTAATPTFASETLSANTNQLTLGTTNTTTVTMAALGASRVFTLPDADSNPVRPLTCTAGDFVSAIASTGVLTCATPAGSGTVTTTGSPANGNLTKFSGATSITNGDLAGDVTTSGTLTTTLANIPTGTPMAGSLLATAIAAPAAPAAGKGSIYVDSTSKNLAVKDDAGVVKHGVRTLTCGGADFVNAIADDGTVTCGTPAGSGTVTTTGTPASGNLTKFSGATSITNGDLAGDVTTSGTLTTTIANDAVTYAKMQNVSAASRILCRGSAAGAGDPQECDVSAPVTISGTTISSSFTASSSDTLTNKAFDAEGTGNVLKLPVKVWIPAAGCDNATAGTVFDRPTSNAPTAACYGTSPMRFGGLDHADGANALTSQVSIQIPSDWDSAQNVDLVFVWFSASTSTNSVVWTAATKCIADTEDLLNPTFNTAQTVADANSATANTRNTANISAVTMTGCATGETLFLRVGRDPTNASDTLAATAVLVGIEVTFRRSI